MQTYDKFYHKHGTRFVRDFIAPIVWNSSDIAYPRSSMLLWNNTTSTKEWPSRNIGYFNTIRKAYVYNIIRYVHDDIIMNPKERNVSSSKVMSKAKHVEPKFKYLPDSKEVSVPMDVPIIFNLGVLNSGYRYAPHPMTPYHVWENSFSTAVTLATAKKTGVNRHKFIYMALPFHVPSRAIIKKYTSGMTRGGLKSFTDHTLFNILELFRFVNKEYVSKSVLAKYIDPSEFKYVDLILTINNKVCLVNLGLLASITDAHEIESKLVKYPSKTITSLLYIYFNRIIEASAIVGDGRIKTLSYLTGDKISSNAEDIDITASLDDIITTEISEAGDAKALDVSDVKGDIDEIINTLDTEDTMSDTITVDVATANVSEDLTDNTKLLDTIDSLASSNLITKVVKKSMIEAIEEQSTKASPYNDGTRLKDMLTPNISKLEIPKEKVLLSDSPSILDKSMSRDPIGAMSNTYHKETMHKDILSTIYAIQKSGMVIKDHEITSHRDILEDTDIHKLTLQNSNGAKSTITVHIPVVADDGTMKMGGGQYILRKQRADVPVKKITNNIVSLNSYYGKLFISRNTFKKDDLGYWFLKQLLKMYDVDKQLKDIALVGVLEADVIAPKHYTLLSRYIKGLTYKGIVFNFEYSNRVSMLKDLDLHKIEIKGSVLVGHKGSTPVVMNSNNTITILNKDNDNLGTIFEYLNIDMTKSPIEYCNAKIYKEQIPVGILLSYYLGLNNVFKLLKAKYTTIDTGKRIILTKDEFRIIFEDITYVVTRDYGKGDMILAGIASISKYTKNITQSAMQTRSSFGAVFSAMSLPILYVNEIKLMENMFVDPITKQVLELFKMPTSFIGILGKAVEMLEDDSYKHPNSLDGSIIKGYERISGMLYLELIKAIRMDVNKSHFSRSKIEFNPFSINTKISGDSTTVIVDDLNPMAILKQSEDVTYLGSHGRKEETMSMATRVMHKSEIGVISESVKDSGAVGISAYMSAAPKLATTRGTFSKLNKEDGWASKLSTSAMLAPFGTNDDSKRLNFVGIMNAHVIPIANMHAPYVRTGYETIMGIKSSDKYAASAEDDGKVTDVSDSSITVKYKSGGIKKYSLKEWSGKEEAGSSYSHKSVTNLKKGNIFKKDDTITYDNSFFEPDIFDPTRVIYKQGDSLTVALMESRETYEDSGALSTKAAKRMSTTLTKTRSIRLINTDNVHNPISTGDKVNSVDVLLSIIDAELANISGLDNKALDILQGLKKLSPKANYEGTVSKVSVRYNCDFSDLSPSIKKLAKISDDLLTESEETTGKVTSGYNIKGIPLLDNEVEIKYYIKMNDSMGIGDKAVIGNQLKFTIGEVFDDEIISLDGTVIDCLFSTMSIEARIVNSPGLIGTSSKLLEVVTNNAVDMYFGESN